MALIICPNCGYSFKRSINYDKKNFEEESVFDNDLLTKWKKVSPVDGAVMKLFKIIKFIVYILPVVFIVIAAVSLMNWMNADSLVKLASVIKTINTLKIMVALICIVGILDVLYEPVMQAYVKLNCGAWIKRMKIDAVGYLKDHYNEIGETKDIEDYSLLCEATFLADKYANKNGIYASLIIRLIFAIAIFTCGGICIMQNLTETMNANVIGNAFEFQYKALISVGIIAVIGIIAVRVSESSYDKKFKIWFKKYVEGAD